MFSQFLFAKTSIYLWLISHPVIPGTPINTELKHLILILCGGLLGMQFCFMHLTYQIALMC